MKVFTLTEKEIAHLRIAFRRYLFQEELAKSRTLRTIERLARKFSADECVKERKESHEV